MDEEEAALLAELRAISSRAAASRFEDDDSDNHVPAEEAQTVAKHDMISDNHNDVSQPVDDATAVMTTRDNIDDAVDEPTLAPEQPTISTILEGDNSGFVSSSTFTGDRGGAAEDAELLAELRAISAKSSRVDRFASSNNDDDNGDSIESSLVTAEQALATSSSSPSSKYSPPSTLPPWKRGNKKVSKTLDVDVVVAAPPPVPQKDETKEEGIGLKSEIQSTFTGDRGGAAEDAELLAELRAISAKSTSMDRFAGGSADNGDTEVKDTSPTEEASSSFATKSISSVQKSSSPSPPPPWKRKKKQEMQGETAKVDVIVAAPPAPAPQTDLGNEAGGFNSSVPSTFTGDRGGAAEDAELLAELRAISSRFTSTDRFADDNNGHTTESKTAPDEDAAESSSDAVPNSSSRKSNREEPSSSPPWKQGKVKASKSPNMDVVVAAPAPSAPNHNMGGFKSSAPPSTFSGERGGAAEDAELLAELRAISAKSTSTDRFAGGDDDDGGTGSIDTPVESSLSSSAVKQLASKSPSSLPPWKRGKKKIPVVADVEVVVAAPPASSALNDNMGGFKSSAPPSSFSGERGGAAEDADLLAELRAISAKSASTDRFSGGDDDDGGAESIDTPVENSLFSSAEKSASKSPSSLPPWKRGKKKIPVVADVEVVVAAPPAPSAPNDNMGGFKSSASPSTFSGERGGAAEDAELLAELRSISAKSSSVDVRAPRQDVDVVKGGLKSSLPSTFTGDRGGAAEDADLLAELRAISSGSGSSTRFTKGGAPDAGGQQQSVSDAPNSSSLPQTNRTRSDMREIDRGSHPPDSSVVSQTRNDGPGSVSSAPPMFAQADEESLVSLESLPSAVTDNKNWKVRKQAYELLERLLTDAVAGKEPDGTFDAESIMNGLDDIIPKMLADTNASALDSALQFGLVYAEYCRGAASADNAAKNVASLVKGSGFSSSRPTTAKRSTSLTLKLMEVGSDGVASVNAVTDVLLSQGLASRKPKVVLAAVTLILDSAYAFGAGCLPLALVSSSAPKILSHSNAKIRDTGMKIIAEICRAAGSRVPLQDVIINLKKAQLAQLDALLEAQPSPSPVTVGLRSKRNVSSATESPNDVLAGFEAGAKELEAKRFSARPAVNIFQELPKTDYSTRIKLQKWSEKVAALDTLLQCGGEKPYKLVQPSSSANYGTLINEMKKLLAHTHFAVSAKSMQVLSMFAEGVGEKLFPHLRPFLPTLIQLSKDKKLTRAAGSCLDSFFGNVINIDHVIDKDDALPGQLDERKQKNALVRTSGLQFLQRCVERRESAGPRGNLTVRSAERIANLCCITTGDSDAGVRKGAISVLQALLSTGDADIAEAVDVIIEDLKGKNPRAYKTLRGNRGNATVSRKVTNGASNQKSSSREVAASASSKVPVSTSPARKSRDSGKSTKKVSQVTTLHQKSDSSDVLETSSRDAPTIDEALAQVSALNIPGWTAAEDDGGILAGLKSSKWLSRQQAIHSLVVFSKSDELMSSSEGIPSEPLLVVVKEHTKGFKESNVNIMKAIMELFLALCKAHETLKQPLCSWACTDGVNIAADKVADRKLSALSYSLLTALCVVRKPQTVVGTAVSAIEKVKSPLSHEAMLKWCRDMTIDFGASAVGKGVNEMAPWLLQECGSANLKVRNAALQLIGELHSQLGPGFKALLLSMCSDSPAIKGHLERTFQECPFNPSNAEMERSKKCVLLEVTAGGDQQSGASSSTFSLDIAKTDLVASLPNDCIKKMGSKEGKTSWKMRKEAMDEVAASLEKCNGLVSTTNLKSLVELLRALRERLSDSQSNLKPVAAALIGSILAAVDKVSQAKLGKIVYAPLINAAMNDNRKPMREAALRALRDGTSLCALEGSGPNGLSLESFMLALVSELSESEYKAGGIPDVLSFVGEVAEFLPNLESIVSSRAQSLGYKFASVVVSCLTSSKGETRSAAEFLLKSSLENGTISMASVKKSTERLLPAQQRSVAPIIVRLQDSVPGSPQKEKENLPTKSASTGRGMSKSGARIAQTDSSARTSTSTRKTTTTHKLAVPATATIDSPQKATRASVDEVVNPLKPKNPVSGTTKQSRLSSRNWPEFPEEPSSTNQLNSLKKLWSQLIPTSTISVLFPVGGIRKQEDAKGGCELLVLAVERERDGYDSAIVDQLDVIFKWLAFSLCSRENTVGLQSLLSLMLDLFDLLRRKKYELTDAEASILIPHVFEKASIAKGRFLDQFNDLIAIVKSDEVLPPNKLGPVICVSFLIERSQLPKARVLAYHVCQQCVEKIGLAGIGKRGLNVTAKALSEEKLPENRNAALDLMESVVARMNGDMKRLARLCGTNLSDKAREMIEERRKKHAGADGSTSPRKASQKLDDRFRRRSQIPSMKKASDATGSDRRRTVAGPQSVSEQEDGVGLDDELPALQLRLRDSSANRSTRGTSLGEVPQVGPFSFSFDSVKERVPSAMESSASVYSGQSTQRLESPSETSGKQQASFDDMVSSSRNTAPPASPTGAAASLRARLLKIREKHNITEGASAPPVETGRDKPTEAADILPEIPVMLSDTKKEPFVQREASAVDVYSDTFRMIKFLLRKPAPVSEDDECLINCISALKKFHAALSNQTGVTTEMSPLELNALRNRIADNTVETIEQITSIIGFAFNCEDPSRSAGISVPLLSVALATLMALFRNDSMALSVSQEPLTLLIRETGKALLDPRLAVSSQSSSGSNLDESTMSQMVRAINKLAVQAATGSTRHVSLQALMTLQLQLCLQNKDSSTDPFINSRLSRIVTKLFSRVIKAEEAAPDPFGTPRVDVEALLCSIEDMLMACNDAQNEANKDTKNMLLHCTDMGKALMVALLESRRNSGGVEEIKSVLDDLGIDSEQSLVASLISSCEAEMKLTLDREPSSPPRGVASPPNITSTRSVDVATLVSAVGSAPEGQERSLALDALKQYKATHGDAELKAYLTEVSAPFRAYILEQLSESSPSRRDISSARSQDDDGRSIPISERIRHLRSKLHVTETAVQSAVVTSDEPMARTQTSSSDHLSSVLGLADESGSSQSRIQAEPPSAVPLSTLTTGSSTENVVSSGEELSPGRTSKLRKPSVTLSLRERLAAAQESRAKANSQEPPPERPTLSAGGHAAALRARLEAVKKQGKPQT